MKSNSKSGFVPISMEKYIELYLKSNPDSKRSEITEGLNEALRDYKDGVMCDCGNPIWVVGSATAVNGCFTCITGEAIPDEDYEIDQAI
jgi:hypothetical protein